MTATELLVKARQYSMYILNLKLQGKRNNAEARNGPSCGRTRPKTWAIATYLHVPTCTVAVTNIQCLHYL